MNNTKSSTIDMKPKDGVKLDTVPLDKTYLEETYYLKMFYTDIYINLVSNMETKKD